MDDLEALRAIAARLIPGAAPWGRFGRPTVVRPAAVPPELPLDFPLPDDSRLIGSCASGSFSLTLLDTDQSPQSVLRFYEGELGPRGWYRHGMQGPSGFLPPGERAAVWGPFCRSPQGPSVRVGAIPRPGTGTELHLQLETDPERSPCAPPPGFRPPRGTTRPHDTPLPMLVAPPGAIMQGFGQGGGEGSHQAHATIQSDLDLRQIMGHFNRLLEEAGWKQGRAGGIGPVAWSSWTGRNETGEDVGGFFLTFRTDTHLYALQLDRDISPGSRWQAEIESRAQARTLKRTAAGDYAARVEIEEPVTGEAIQALHELILRMVARADLNSPDYANPQLLIGRVPESLPVDLPLPSGARVLGSLVLGGRTAIYVESQTGPRQILAFYQTHLSPPSWTLFGERRELGGFVAEGTAEAIAAQFCPEAEGPAISIGAHVRPDGMTDIRLYVVTDLDQTPCGNWVWAPGWEYRSRQPQLPILIAPPQSDFVGGGGGGGDKHWESHGYIYTTMGLRDVADYYGRQFEVAGWTARGRGEDDVVAWSRWSRHSDDGEPVDAVFLAVRYPDSGGYSLVARATSTSGSTIQPHSSYRQHHRSR